MVEVDMELRFGPVEEVELDEVGVDVVGSEHKQLSVQRTFHSSNWVDVVAFSGVWGKFFH
jgi:hypothetical protein